MTKFSEIIQLISIWGITIPLMIGLIHFKAAGFQFRLFVFFLVVGLFTDITMYCLRGTSNSYHLRDILNGYSLVEACFFLWLTYNNTSVKLLKRISKSLLIVTPLFWLLLMIIRSGKMNTSPGQVFDPFYEVSVAFLAGFILLQIVEQDTTLDKNPIFWILLGIFFYCFCTFFIMGFLNTLLSQKIWFLNNIINIITYIFYSVGLWKCHTSLKD